MKYLVRYENDSIVVEAERISVDGEVVTLWDKGEEHDKCVFVGHLANVSIQGMEDDT